VEWEDFLKGLVLVNAMHITASVFINNDESGLHQDYEDWLEELAPHEPISQYRHNRTGEDWIRFRKKKCLNNTSINFLV